MSTQTDIPPPAGVCSDCGATDLLTLVHLSPPAARGQADGAPEDSLPREALLCPACLSESLTNGRSQGVAIEARLNGGRIVRW